jgi:hypothetical protein
MLHDYVLWVMVVAYALHIVEEHSLDWKGWVKRHANLDVPLADSYVVNAALVVGMIATAMIGWRLPELSLAPAALVLINGLFFPSARVWSSDGTHPARSLRPSSFCRLARGHITARISTAC